MKAEKVYSAISDYVSCLEEKEFILYLARRRIRDANILADLLMDAEEEMKQEAAKSAGRSNTRSAVLKMIKWTQKNQVREAIHGAWTGADGRQYICSGYHMVALNQPVDVPTAEGMPDVEKMIPSAIQNQGDAVTCPSAADVAAYIKLDKSAHKGDRRWDGRTYIDLAEYNNGDERFPVVNAELLLQTLQILPGCEVYLTGSEQYEPLLFRSEDGDAIVLPVRRTVLKHDCA